tara:strand:- start:6077 stop:6586 length:510 start_codon:yes stop_codon:yes gene_type:complete
MDKISNLYEEREVDFDDFIIDLLKEPPGAPKTTVLCLDVNDLNIIFERLLEIFHEITKYLYGDNNNKVDLKNMKQDELEIIQKYFNSFCFKIIIKIIPKNVVDKFKYFVKNSNNFKIEKNEKDINLIKKHNLDILDISDYKFVETNKLSNKRGNLLVKDTHYIISFDYL